MASGRCNHRMTHYTNGYKSLTFCLDSSLTHTCIQLTADSPLYAVRAAVNPAVNVQHLYDYRTGPIIYVNSRVKMGFRFNNY